MSQVAECLRWPSALQESDCGGVLEHVHEGPVTGGRGAGQPAQGGRDRPLPVAFAPEHQRLEVVLHVRRLPGAVTGRDLGADPQPLARGAQVASPHFEFDQVEGDAEETDVVTGRPGLLGTCLQKRSSRSEGIHRRLLHGDLRGGGVVRVARRPRKRGRRSQGLHPRAGTAEASNPAGLRRRRHQRRSVSCLFGVGGRLFGRRHGQLQIEPEEGALGVGPEDQRACVRVVAGVGQSSVELILRGGGSEELGAGHRPCGSVR